MAKRHEDALAISNGACNPSGIALSIVDACREARAEGKTAHEDAAVRLMVHQLAFISNIHRFDDGDEYHKALVECGYGH
jgi:hypothetical protein